MTDDTASWLLDEVARAGRENLDPSHVARYDAKEDAGAEAEVRFLEDAGVLRASSTVIDMGAGTGQFALAAGPRCARLIAVDVSQVMLDRLRSNLERSGLANVECEQAGFLTYEHRGVLADLVYSRYALHHLPDFWKAVALSRMAAMLRPGGTLRLWDVVYHFDPHESAARLGAWVAETAGSDVDDAWTAAELAEHIRDEDSTFTWLLEPMLERAGFSISDARYSDSGIFAQYLCHKT